MRPRTQKQPQVKKELCQALDDVDVKEYSNHNNKNNYYFLRSQGLQSVSNVF